MQRRTIWHIFIHPFSLKRATRIDLLLSTSILVAFSAIFYGRSWMPPELFIVVFVSMLVDLYFCMARRLHDIGATGLLVLLAFIPGVLPILVIILLIAKPNVGDNKYGYDPRDCRPEHFVLKAGKRKFWIVFVDEYTGDEKRKWFKVDSIAEYVGTFHTLADEIQKYNYAIAHHNAETCSSLLHDLSTAGHGDWADIIKRGSDELTKLGLEINPANDDKMVANIVGFTNFFRAYVLDRDIARRDHPSASKWIELCMDADKSRLLPYMIESIRNAAKEFERIN